MAAIAVFLLLCLVLLLHGVHLCLDEGVPVELLASKVVDKVRECPQTLGKELVEWMTRQYAHGEDAPLLDTERFGVIHLPDFALIDGRRWQLCFQQRIKEVWDGETDPIRVDVALCVCEHENVEFRV